MGATTALELEPVAQIAARLDVLLEKARALKQILTVEPPLPTAGLEDDVDVIDQDLDERYDQTFRFNAVETAARETFYRIISTTAISSPDFVEIWNLLDVLLLCGDRGKCTPELVCYLLEEMLDSQTTSGCRTVFDYLESRRERLVQRDFHKKNLIFLRSCNELLRRLSRAEDAIFCGRVFFFLFQTFPLGDKSSVNLRGEFHTENSTLFEDPPPKPEDSDVNMKDADATVNATGTETPKLEDRAKAETPKPQSQPSQSNGVTSTPSKATKETPKKSVEEKNLDNSTLYPIFWRLQQDFSDPTRLFVASNFATFKKGLESTLVKFKKTAVVVQTKVNSQRGTKRKLGEDGEEIKDHLAENYNPKYLTSRDLFDLELSDLAFQRHILVQALILIDFLLSLTEKGKKKLAALELANKSMLYNFTLSEDDAKWANTTRADITNYLQQGSDGKFYHRMVETVLTRDKNCVRWKIESCPSIVRDPVSTAQELEARRGARDAARIRPLPKKPLGAMDLSFLSEGGSGTLDALKDPNRYTAPSIEELVRGVQNDELDLEMAMTDEEKASLETGLGNKTWRALREARMNDLSALDRVEPGKKLEDVFRKEEEAEIMVDGTAVVVSVGLEAKTGSAAVEDPAPDPEASADGTAVENGVNLA